MNHSQPKTQRQVTAVIPVIVAGLAMLGPFSIDTVFPAFDRIQQNLAVTEAATQQLVSLYLFPMAIMSIFYGPLSDAFGRKKVITTSLVCFAIASVGCALAPNLTVLLACRVGQGLSAGGSMIVGRTVVRDVYTGALAQRMMSRVMVIFSIAPAIAPIVGGWLLYWGAWPIIFWFLGALAAGLIYVVYRWLPETHPPADRVEFSAASILTTMGQVATHPPSIRINLVLAFSFGALFLYIGAAAIFVVDLLHFGEQDFWVFFVPVISCMTLGALLSGRLAGRVPSSQLITVALCAGLGVTAVNVCLAVFPSTTSMPWPIVGPALLATCVAVAMPAIQLAVMDQFPAARGTATSLSAFIMLTLNAATAGLLVPLIANSVLTLAVTALGFAALALGIWLWHRRFSQNLNSTP